MSTRVLLDACVLVSGPTRALLLGAARRGWFIPLWSPRILAEWRHAAARNGVAAALEAETEQARMTEVFPDASVGSDGTPLPALADLPDAGDTHVLAAAIAGGAEELLTANTSDFPMRRLAEHRILRRQPDEFLLELAHAHPEEMARLARSVHAAMAGTRTARRGFRNAGLPRFGKWLETAAPPGTAA